MFKFLQVLHQQAATEPVVSARGAQPLGVVHFQAFESGLEIPRLCPLMGQGTRRCYYPAMLWCEHPLLVQLDRRQVAIRSELRVKATPLLFVFTSGFLTTAEVVVFRSGSEMSGMPVHATIHGWDGIVPLIVAFCVSAAAHVDQKSRIPSWTAALVEAPANAVRTSARVGASIAYFWARLFGASAQEAERDFAALAVRGVNAAAELGLSIAAYFLTCAGIFLALRGHPGGAAFLFAASSNFIVGAVWWVLGVYECS